MNLLNKIATINKNIGFKKYLKNTSWMLAEQASRMLTGLFLGIWVARYFGPERFGIYSYAIAFATIFSSFAKLGLDSTVIRNLVISNEKENQYLGTAFWLKIFGSLITISLVYFALNFTKNDNDVKLYVFIIASSTIFQAFEVVEFYFQSKTRMKSVSVCKISQQLISLIIKIYLIITGSEVISFIIIVLFDQIILASALLFSFVRTEKKIFINKFSIPIAKELLKPSFPLLLSSIVVMIYMKIDHIFIKEILGEEYVGIYSAAVRVCEAFFFIPMILTNSLFPSLVNAKRFSNDLYNQRLRRIFAFLIWTAILVSLFITYFGPSIVHMLYGNAYQSAATVLIIYTWCGVFVSIGASSNSWYVIENLQRYAFYRTLLGAATSVVLNYILIPVYGLIGAAIAALASQAMAALFFDLLTPTTRPLFYIKINSLLLKEIF